MTSRRKWSRDPSVIEALRETSRSAQIIEANSGENGTLVDESSAVRAPEPTYTQESPATRTLAYPEDARADDKDVSFASVSSSHLDHTITASIGGELNDRTLTPSAYDTQSLYSEQSLTLVDDPPAANGAPSKPPRGSFRAERKTSRKLPAPPVAKTAEPALSPVVSSSVVASPSAPAALPPTPVSPVIAIAAGQQPSAGTVRKSRKLPTPKRKLPDTPSSMAGSEGGGQEDSMNPEDWPSLPLEDEGGPFEGTPEREEIHAGHVDGAGNSARQGGGAGGLRSMAEPASSEHTPLIAAKKPKAKKCCEIL